MLITAGLLVLLAAGCATVKDASESEVAVPQRSGVYHKVQKGQTLWRIAQAYQVSIEDIIAGNSIPDAALIEENQLIFIPGAPDVQEVPAVLVDPSHSEFGWPIQGRVLRYFGDRVGTHRSRGIRIEAHEGQTVQASRQGRVIFADYLTGYAYTVILDHADGFYSVYGRNSELLVNLGDSVPKGAPVAKAGRNGEGSFLHFEVRKDTAAENPLYYLPR